jgi:GntR family transcriptional regulator
VGYSRSTWISACSILMSNRFILAGYQENLTEALIASYRLTTSWHKKLPNGFAQLRGIYRGSVSELAAPGGQDDQLAYRRVADDVAARITSGELASGTRLRSEHDLAEHYQVSFGTLRRAMKLLRERGMIVTQHGRGNFVA